MKHQILPTIELIRDLLADIDLFYATQAGDFNQEDIVVIVTGCAALLYHAEKEGELHSYPYGKDIERKVMRYQLIYQPEKAAAAPLIPTPYNPDRSILSTQSAIPI